MKRVIKASSPTNRGYLYLTKHGIGPGTLPKDVKLLRYKDLSEYITAIWLDRFLTTKELDYYDIYPETGMDKVLERNGIDETVESLQNVMSASIGGQDITASTHSTSDLAQFMKESVNTLLNSGVGNCQYKLDSDWAVYVGWSETDYTDSENLLHYEDDPSWIICCKIATTHEMVWADYDWCDMPYNDKTGEVWDTDMALSPEENYQQTAKWLLDQYNELIRQIESGEFVPHKYN